MPPETALPFSPPPAALPAPWRRPLGSLVVVAALLFALFWRDWADMAGQWWNSSTYNHVVLIPPILGWLVWQRWLALRRLDPAPWWPGLALFGAAVLLWVLGSFAGFSLLRQAGAVAMLGSAVLALLGPAIGAALAFPLAYMAFLVPFGDELIAPLQTITAKLTVVLVHLSGIPAAIDGVFIDTPAGLFEVAEACSGIKFLIAMIAFGVLAANVCFVSWRRRAAFLLLCALVPVLANGVRAWGTIAVAQIKGAAYAGGFDHIVYGWLFFALVIAAVILIGWRFFDRDPATPVVDPAAIAASPLIARLSRQTLRLPAALGLLAAIAAAGLAWSSAADRLDAPLPRQIHLPEVPGWHRVNYAPALWWEPRAAGANHRLLGRYADGQGHQVDVFYALWSGQSEGREAGGFGQGALVSESGWAWQADGPAVPGGHAERLLGKGTVERLAETHYRTGPLLTGSNMRLKLANIADRLLLRERPTAVLILSAEPTPSAPPESSVAAFRASVGPVGPWMDRLGSGR